jgi:hypothetical protein
MCQAIALPPSLAVMTAAAASTTIDQWNRRTGQSQTWTTTVSSAAIPADVASSVVEFIVVSSSRVGQ